MTVEAQTRFELERTVHGWGWRLVDGETVLGVGRGRYESASTAVDAVTTVRAAAAVLEGDVPAFDANTDSDGGFDAHTDSDGGFDAHTDSDGGFEFGNALDVDTGSNPDGVATRDPGPVVDARARVRGERVTHVITGVQGHFEWTLRVGDRPLASPAFTYPSKRRAADAGRQFRRSALGATVRPVALAAEDRAEPSKGSDDGATPQSSNEGVTSTLRDTFQERVAFTVSSASLGESVSSLGRLLFRGPRHRRTLERVPTRISISGIRGKSSTARRLDDIFTRRGYDSLTKITGNYPHLLYDGGVVPLDRPGRRTTLYENARVVAEYVPKLVDGDADEVLIVENQGITEYTTRLVNQAFVRPHLVVLTNVRADHLDTLGRSRRDLARSFARSIPTGAHVVSGEQHEVIQKYLEREVERVGATISHVSIPDRHSEYVAAETVYALDEVLETLGGDPLSDAEREAYLDAAQPEWLVLPGGRVFNATEVNDVESTEMIRRALGGGEVIVPFVFLRADRRGRTASFATYVDLLAERGVVERVHVAGEYSRAFAAAVDVPVERHDLDADPATVLDDLLRDGDPVMLMGNTVDEFMRGFERELTRRVRRHVVSVPADRTHSGPDEQPNEPVADLANSRTNP